MYLALGGSFAGRQAESVYTDWKQVKKRMENTVDGEVNYKVEYERVKNSSAPETADSLIIGKLEVESLDAYAACFPEEQKKGRYFRYLKLGVDGQLRGSEKPVGKNTISKFGIQIATLLELPDPELYTGHFLRRTSATRCADAGMTLAQIKVVTGHKSDTVVQGVSELNLY